MPKNPPDLPHLLPSADPADRVQVQQTNFSYDVLGRYVCNDWDEVEAQQKDGGFPFDAVVIGAGMFGGYCAEKLYRYGADLNLRILVLDAGAFLFPTHIQNLPQRLGGAVGGPAYSRTRDDASHTQNVVWGMPWISNELFPGLAYCIGGRSLFWGGWSPRLTDADLTNWPQDLVAYLLGTAAGPGAYDLTEREIGVADEAQFITRHMFHDTLLADLNAAQPGVSTLTRVEEAPLAVQASAPGPGLFPFDKFSSADFLVDAVREDAGNNPGVDTARRLFVVPRTQVVRLNLNGNTVSSIDAVTNGVAKTLPIPPRCAVVLAAGTIETTRLALDSLGIGSMAFNSPRVGNLMAHLRSNITVRIKRTALGLPASPPAELETTAYLVRGTSRGRQFHFQVSAAAAGGANPEKNMWEQIPDVEFQDQIRATQDPNWITIIFRCIGEMGGQRSLNPDPAASWIDLSAETDDFHRRRAFVNLVKQQADTQLWFDMDTAAFQLAAALVTQPADIEYWNSQVNAWQQAAPPIDPQTGGYWRDLLGSTHHEAGTLYAGDPGISITDTRGKFHDVTNAYVAGPAVFPTLGSANPSLTGLSLVRRTAHTIVAAGAGAPPATGFTPLSLSPTDWQLVSQAGSQPRMLRYGTVLETAGGYGLSFYTKEAFANFALWVEWRETHTGDNSGVFIRTPGTGVGDPLQQAVDQGHEIQIDDLGAPEGAGIHRTGAIYALQAPSSFPIRPLGEWNTYLITANGNQIDVTLNGIPINSYTSTRGTSGYLALQMHDFPSRVQFRNLQVKKLA
jgi:choline dehydrogenase-like flavoprotein